MLTESDAAHHRHSKSTRTGALSVAIVALVAAGATIVGAQLTQTDQRASPTPPTVGAPPDHDLVGSLGDVSALAGPVRLMHASSPAYQLRIDRTGQISATLREELRVNNPVPEGTELEGYPVATVADGVLVIPNEKALGALTYWTPEGGLEQPLPEEPHLTSYLAAGQDTAVLLSSDEIVVLDMSAGTERLRVDALVGDAAVVRACLSPDQQHLALVGSDGTVVVKEIATNMERVVLNTNVVSGGIAWTAPGQLAFLTEEDEHQTVRVTNVASDEPSDLLVAATPEQGPWQLISSDVGC